MNRPDLISSWSDAMLDAARQAFLGLVIASPEGEWRELAQQLVSLVASNTEIPVDEDALADDLDVRELLPTAMNVCAEDDSTAWMGPSYREYLVLNAGEKGYLVFDDEIETGSYSLVGRVTSLESACAVIGSCAIESLGGNGPIHFDGVAIDPEAVTHQDEDFWSDVLLPAKGDLIVSNGDQEGDID